MGEQQSRRHIVIETLVLGREKMDEYVKSKLTEWNLAELIPTFEAEKIDQESLFLLDDSTLTSLIPITGLRLKFRKYLRNAVDESSKEPAVEPATIPREQQHGPEHRISAEHAAEFNVRDILLATSDGRALWRKSQFRNKSHLASSVVEQFPCLKDCQGKGYEAWFSPGRYHRPATGFLEERLRNVRKRVRGKQRNRVSSDNPRDSSNFIFPDWDQYG
ncbi:hypothetical protein QQF64_000119 [Cirrhinus molitorella]|uniref:SAM domain-containing protein n=1 Tax=Cirrhinus molitorella TaxID=172907 RepID=A0ABR3NXM5_9TELE